jgi:hypothetical protein
MRKKREPHAERNPVDYRAAANALELAKALAGQGGTSDQDFLQRMARSVPPAKTLQGTGLAGRRRRSDHFRAGGSKASSWSGIGLSMMGS